MLESQQALFLQEEAVTLLNLKLGKSRNRQGCRGREGENGKQTRILQQPPLGGSEAKAKGKSPEVTSKVGGYLKRNRKRNSQKLKKSEDSIRMILLWNPALSPTTDGAT